MPYLNRDHVTIYYETRGNANKPALIFSNSLGTTMTMWQPQIDALKQEFYIINYDTRGHGHSTALDKPFTIDELGDDVIALLDHLAIQQAYFCGISLGGLTGQWLGIHQPKRFYKLMVSNTAAKIGNTTAWQERAALARHQGLQAIADSAAERWFTQPFINTYPQLVNAMCQTLAQLDANGYANCCEALGQADLRDQLSIIEVPLLVVVGSQDPVTTQTDGEYIVNQVKNGTLAMVDASHIANIEQPDTFNTLISEFLKV